MRFNYDADMDLHIIKHEEQMLKAFSTKIQKYLASLKIYGCNAEVELFWCEQLVKNPTYERLGFDVGYACYVNCEVRRDGQVVKIKSRDGEADYYELSASWTISSISRNFLEKIVDLYSNTDDMDHEMEEWLRLLAIG